MDNIPDILDVEDDSLIYLSDDEVSDSSGTIDDELLSLVSDDGSQSPMLLAIDQLEGAARDVAALGEGQHDDLDPPKKRWRMKSIVSTIQATR